MPGTLGSGPALLSEALSMEPLLQLTFYRAGIILRKPTENGAFTEYPVNPDDIAKALSKPVVFSTGLITLNTIFVQTDGLTTTVAEYRPPQVTVMRLEGSDAPVEVPLPPLIMIRRSNGEVANYLVTAVKKRPTSLDTPTYHAPLCNVYNDGRICWGSVPKVSSDSLKSVDVTEDWHQLLHSMFTPHGVSGKSYRFSSDIRKMYLDLEQKKAKKYPIRDLVSDSHTIGDYLRA